MVPHQATEQFLQNLVSAVASGANDLFAALDELPDAIYVTDADGTVTFFNRACMGFSGRTPVAGKDRWCVTWKLYTDEGAFLPHAECPMAIALQTKKPVRGMTAIAERPDGTRVNFMPFPTPLFGPSGEFIGAVNLLLDITDHRQIAELRSQADRCRRLAKTLGDHATVNVLLKMAEDFDAKAISLEAR